MAIGDRNPTLCPNPEYPIEGPYGRCYSEDFQRVEPPRAPDPKLTPVVHFPTPDDPEFRAGYGPTGLWIIGLSPDGFHSITAPPGTPALDYMNAKALRFDLPAEAAGLFTDRIVVSDPASGKTHTYRTFDSDVVNTYGRL